MLTWGRNQAYALRDWRLTVVPFHTPVWLPGWVAASFLHARRSDARVRLSPREYSRRCFRRCNSECFLSHRHTLMVNTSSVYWVETSHVKSHKFTYFSKGNQQLTVFEFRNSTSFDAFLPKSYYSQDNNNEFDWLLKSSEIGCFPWQKLI